MPAAVLPVPLPLPPEVHRGGASGHVLDDPAEWEASGRPVAGREGTWESYLAIEGIHCAGCSLTIEQALAGLPGGQDAEVNGARATARIAWGAAQVRPSQWLAALERAGSRALPAGDQLAAV